MSNNPHPHHQLNQQQAPPSGTNYTTTGGDPNDYQDWANNDFNLLEFIGVEDNGSPSNPSFSNHHNNNHFDDPNDQPEEESMDKKDRIYQDLQYNALMCEPSMDGYVEAPHGYLNHDHHQQLATPPTFMAGPENGIYSNGNGVMDGSQIPSTSRAPNTVAVKAEPPSTLGDYYESESDQHSSSGRHSMETESRMGGGPMRDTPTSTNGYQPRKYRVKSEVEKRNPVYKVKRERNNDAVRRSRDKAKKEQELKDDRLHQLEQESRTHKAVVARLQERNINLERALLELNQMKKSCKCNAFRRVL